MAATLTIPPPSRCFSDSPLWVALTTDATISAEASIVLTISGGGPSAAETLRIQFAGNDLTFTVADPLTANALDLPVKGALSLADYADALADRMRAHEVLHDYFSISRSSSGGETITLTQRLLSVVEIVVTDALSNVTAVATSVTEVTTADALRALVEVWKLTDSAATDTRLLSIHTPYLLPSGTTEVDIHAAFAGLRPHLPDTSGIYPGLITSLICEEATDCYLNYYLRYADKSGLPAIAETLQRSASNYMAILGAAAGGTLAVATTPLRHNYVRANGSTILPKPILDTQPDWMYWVCPSGVTEVYMAVTLYWSDGTDSLYLPFDDTPVTVYPGKMYYFGTGPRQLKIGSADIPSGTADDAYVVGYLAALARPSGFLIGVHSVTYTLHYASDWMYPIILFSNGVGGCETVGFRGKTTMLYETTSEEYRLMPTRSRSTDRGDFSVFSTEGRGEWQVNTGWCDLDYLRHLQQLPLADAAWLVDLAQQRFLKVIVQPGQLETNKDDETLFSLSFSIRAGWVDSAFNV